MKAGAIIAIVAIPVVLGGGAAAYFLLRKRGQAGAQPFQVMPKQDSRDLAAAQMTAGPAAVASSGGGGGLNVSGLAAMAGGAYMNKMLPGSGQYVGSIINGANSVLKKVPGLGSLGSKLKLW